MKLASIFKEPKKAEDKDQWFKKVVKILKDNGFKFYTQKKLCPSCGKDMFLIEYEWICVECQHREVIN